MKNKGFTLIELLVVVAIIGILSAVTVAIIGEARIRAEEAKRVAVFNEIEKALELYYVDNGRYPPLYAHTYHTGANHANFNNALQPYIKIDISDPLFGPYYSGQDPQFQYKSSSANGYQSYGMMMRVYGNRYRTVAENDGGFSSGSYEVGQDPSYCMEKYGGSWWYSTGRVCAAGN